MTIEQKSVGRTSFITGRIPDIRGWIDKRYNVDPSWGNISWRDVAQVKSGKMGTDALRLWIRLNGPRVNPVDDFMDTVLKLCPAAERSMREIIENRFQEHPANTTAALMLGESENGTVVISIIKIMREKTMGEDGQFYLAEKKSILASSHPCEEIPAQPSRRQRLAQAAKVIWRR